MALKSTGKSLKGLEKFLILLFTVGFNTVDGDLNQYKLLCLYLVQHLLHQIKAQQCYAYFQMLKFSLSRSNIPEVEFHCVNQHFS